jgi:hypothetical protein
MAVYRIKRRNNSAVLASIICKSVGSPYSRKLLTEFTTPEAVRSLTAPKSSEYDNPSVFALDYGCYNFMKKLPASDKSRQSQLERLAIDSFRAIDSRVMETNRRLRGIIPRCEGILALARRKITQILGEFSFPDFVGGCDWGPGATSSLRGRDARLDIKIREQALSVTPTAYPYLRSWMSNDILWMQARLGTTVEGYCSPLPSEFSLVRGGRLTTVPKDWNRLRTIDIQPTGNLFLQKGLGKMIRTRLRRVGVDLNDQTRNQQLALRAHVDRLATLDLENASDTVSSRLVRELLPDDWYEHMDALRTRSVQLPDGSWHDLAKFSAMGNGFTFELESLIFYALCWAVVRAEMQQAGPIGVYGDDLIVPSVCANRLVEVLSGLGFTTNASKTFIEGRFYESCGKHYFDGFDVTPPYQKEEVCDLPSSVRCANRLFRWALRLGAGLSLDAKIRPAWQFAASLCFRYSHFGLFGASKLPLQYWTVEGDFGLIRPEFDPPSSLDGKMRFSGISLIKRQVRADGASLLHQQLRVSPGSEPTYGFLNPRGECLWHITQRTTWVRRVACPDWV